jgi:hypothetical protein
MLIEGTATQTLFDVSVCGNVCEGNAASDGIALKYVEDGVVASNRCDNFSNGASEDANSDDILWGVNHLRGNTSATNFNGTNRTEIGNKT